MYAAPYFLGAAMGICFDLAPMSESVPVELTLAWVSEIAEQFPLLAGAFPIRWDGLRPIPPDANRFFRLLAGRVGGDFSKWPVRGPRCTRA